MQKEEKPAVRRIVLENDLRRLIQTRRSGFDEPLVTEQHLSAHYALCRTTVRKVLQKLQNEGLLRRKTGFGTFIVPPEERPLKKVRLRQILLLSHWSQGEYYVQRIVSGILDCIFIRGAELDVVSYDKVTPRRMTDNYHALKFDAVIHDRPRTEDHELIAACVKAGIPQVAVNRTVPGIPSVFSDYENAIRQMTEFCFGTGEKNICFVDSSVEGFPFFDRQQVFLQLLKKHGTVHPEEHLFIPKPGILDQVEAETDAYLQKHPDFRFFLIASSMRDIVLKLFGKRGIAVPGDCSVLILDEDLRNRSFSDFSTFREPVRNMGEVAAKMLYQMQSEKGCSVRSVTLQGELILRKSCRLPFQTEIPDLIAKL